MVVNVVDVRNDHSIVSIEGKDCIFVITLVLILAFVVNEKSAFKRPSLQERRGIEVILVLVVGGVTLKGDVYY